MRILAVVCATMLVLLSIAAATASQAPEPPLAPVTFAHDIGPLLYQHCAGCHHRGGSAPFSLVEYEDVRPRARQILAAVRDRTMPPWKPEVYGGPFVGDRRLRDEEIALVERWVLGGAAAGDLSAMPKSPSFNASAWPLGQPDLIVETTRPYVLPPGSSDIFRNFVFPTGGGSLRYVRAFDFQPSDRRVTHHATIRVDRTRASARLDDADPQPGYVGETAPTAVYPDGHILAWTPGQVPQSLPAGLSWRLEPNSSLVVQLHLMGNDSTEPLRVRIGLYFTDIPPSQPLATLRLGRQDIDIAAGDPRYTVEDDYTLPVSVDLHAIQPHAHHLARTIKAFATLPDGETVGLIDIREWDFHWQDVYRLRQPARLPRGATIRMVYTYDNSSGNPRRSSASPARVHFGERTTDEMAYLWMQVSPVDPADLPALTNDYLPKQLRDDIVGYRKKLEYAPNDPHLHAGIASAYLALRRSADALTHLERAVELDPESDVAHYNLGTALTQNGRLDAAAVHFRIAVQLNPTDAAGHNSLGATLSLTNRPSEAIEEFRAAIVLDPTAQRFHKNLALALERAGRLDQAIREYQEVIRLDPADADTQVRLADALAGSARFSEAILVYDRALSLAPDPGTAMLKLAWLLATAPDQRLRNGARALELARQGMQARAAGDPYALDVVAAAYAETGDYQRAAATAALALSTLTRAGDDRRAGEVRGRLSLYRAGSAYRQPGSRP